MIDLLSSYLAGSPLLSLLQGRCMSLLHNLMVMPAHHGAGLHSSLAFGVRIICLAAMGPHTRSWYLASV